MKEFKNQKKLFDFVWESREHVSELSGRPLLPKTDYMYIWQFLHILPKGTYPKYKLNPDNILLALPEEHATQERFEKFNEKKLQLTQQYYKEFYNKEF